MSNTGKSLAMALILVIAISCASLLAIKPANAQTIPTPSVPQFSVKYIVYTTYVAPTYTINPYTGQNETTSQGYQANNQTIQFTIKNQPFTPYYDSSGNYIDLYYNFRYKGHYATEWTYNPFYLFTNIATGISQMQTTHSYGPYAGGMFTYYNSTGENESVFTFDSYHITIPSSGLEDFQVQAQIGHIDDIPSGMLAGDYYKFVGQSSDWSDTQTISFPDGAVTLSPNTSTPTPSVSPTPSPTSTVPELPALAIVPLLFAVLSAALLVRYRRVVHG
jgi:hypothetical protein